MCMISGHYHRPTYMHARETVLVKRLIVRRSVKVVANYCAGYKGKKRQPVIDSSACIQYHLIACSGTCLRDSSSSL